MATAEAKQRLSPRKSNPSKSKVPSVCAASHGGPCSASGAKTLHLSTRILCSTRADGQGQAQAEAEALTEGLFRTSNVSRYLPWGRGGC